MTFVDRWLLPDGIEDILPERARRIESLRRRLVDLFGRWGYELIIPPLIEYTDSLLIGLGRDIDLMTFKVTDQLSGRSMGIRADITPQTARIDSHSLKRSGPSRLCYAGHVLHARPQSPLATRSPIQAGVELYGEAGFAADVEVISLMLASLQESGLQQLNIDLGHVGVYRSLARAAGLSGVAEQELFDLLQAKATTDIRSWLGSNVHTAELALMLQELPQLAGGREILSRARATLAAAPAEVGQALNTLEKTSSIVAERYPQANLYFDLSELRGYNYITGMVFAAFTPGYGGAIANGGRYDRVGEVFGNARPATGFAIDITALDGLSKSNGVAPAGAVFVAAELVVDAWDRICELRAAGEVVVCGFEGQTAARAIPACDRQLCINGGTYQLLAL